MGQYLPPAPDSTVQFLVAIGIIAVCMSPAAIFLVYAIWRAWFKDPIPRMSPGERDYIQQEQIDKGHYIIIDDRPVATDDDGNIL